MSALLTGDEGAVLLALARATIEERLLAPGALERARASLPLTDGLRLARGVFVTLHLRESDGPPALRGCIGSVEPADPAHEAVVDAAYHAAFRDPRFTPLTAEEYPAVVLSVSALTAPEPAPSPEAIVPGEHGVVLEHPRGRGIFLPEVAEDHGWTRERLLEELARKAGLPAAAWREGRLYLFRSQKFGGW